MALLHAARALEPRLRRERFPRVRAGKNVLSLRPELRRRGEILPSPEHEEVCVGLPRDPVAPGGLSAGIAGCASASAAAGIVMMMYSRRGFCIAIVSVS